MYQLHKMEKECQKKLNCPVISMKIILMSIFVMVMNMFNIFVFVLLFLYVLVAFSIIHNLK